MKRFLLQIIFFTISVAGLFIILFVTLNFAFKNKIENYKVDNKINKLIIGDSHTQNGINDQYLQNTKNFSHSSESLMYSFFKLQALLKNNPQVDTIFLGVSYHSFSLYFDDCFINPELASAYFFILPVKIQVDLLKRSTDRFKLIQYCFRKSFKNLKNAKESLEFLGYYKPYYTKVPINDSSIKERINGQYYPGNRLNGFSTINIGYYKKIVQMCKEHNITVIVLNTPMNKKYSEKVPVEFKNNFYSLTRNGDVKLFEFTDLVLEDGNFLPDGDHLSPAGSILASMYLNESLKNSSLH